MTDLVNRLRGNYAVGPHLPNGNPEFGWRQFGATPINLEAAAEIERLRALLAEAEKVLDGMPAFFYAMALKNAPFKDETKRGFEKWGDELDALLSKLTAGAQSQ